MAAEFDVLVTAEEAWPAFERAVLNARSEIVGGFRIFDLTTRLLSPEAKEIGRDWFDLLTHAVRRGVRIELAVSDFDPVVATELHEQAWETVRQGQALAELAEAAPGQVSVTAALHPARAGAIPWLTFLPVVLRKRANRLRSLSASRKARRAVKLDSKALPDMHTVSHHQKLAVIDNTWLYVGGLDLNNRRYDTLDHDQAAHETWSDIQVMVTGPEVKQARDHLKSFVDVTNRKAAAPDLPALKRTLSVPRKTLKFAYLSPKTVLREIEQVHLDCFAQAKHLIYIETQFLRSSIIAKALANAGSSNPRLRAIVVLPALPDDVAFHSSDSLDARFGLALQYDAVNRLMDVFGERITFCTPVRPVMATRDAPSVLAGSPVIHVHNKVLVKDDDYVLIGSANLNGRSLRWDTEVAVETKDTGQVAQARRKLMDHWWFSDLPDEARAPQTMQQWWHDAIAKNGVRLPENRSGFLVPYDPDAKADIRQPLPGVTEDMV